MSRTKIHYLFIAIIFLLGIFLRLKLYVTCSAFEDDECRLAITMLGKNLWQMFLPLGDAQSAPPLFVLCSKILANICGYSEKVLWIIPLLAGVAGMFCFYKLAEEYFEKKISVLISLFIFAVNSMLVQYSSIFKQYSTDVLVGILCLYYLSKININNLNKKQLAILILSMIILPFVSLPSIFFIGGMLVINFVKNYRNKKALAKIFVTILPFVLTMILYYVFNLAPSKADMDISFPNYWNDGFLTASYESIMKVLVGNIKYYLMPNSLSFFTLILLLWGVVLMVKDKVKPLSCYILSVYFLILLASALHLYPYCLRVGLYAISMFILLIIKPLDYYESKKPIFYIILFFVFASLFKYDFAYLKSLNDNELYRYSPKKLMIELKERFNPKTDVVICNSASSASYIYYSSKYDFRTDGVYEMDTRPNTRESTMAYLKSLKSGQRFWLYLIKDYRDSKIFPYIQEWLDTIKPENILFSIRDKDSSLIYIQN